MHGVLVTEVAIDNCLKASLSVPLIHRHVDI
jgi:hypothetical protein